MRAESSSDKTHHDSREETATWAHPLLIMALTPPYGGLIRYFMLAISAVILVGCAVHIALQIFWVRYVLVLNADASRFFLIP